jgi:hypothetical protein
MANKWRVVLNFYGPQSKTEGPFFHRAWRVGRSEFKYKFIGDVPAWVREAIGFVPDKNRPDDIYFRRAPTYAGREPLFGTTITVTVEEK